MTGSFVQYPRDPVTQTTTGLRQSLLLKLPSFLKSRKASSSSTSSSSTTDSTTSEKRNHNYTISRRSSMASTLAASEYSVDSEKPRHASVMLSPKEAKKLAKAQEKAARKLQRQLENEKVAAELEGFDRAMKYAAFGHIHGSMSRL